LSQGVVCSPAPSKPSGAKAPGKVRAWGITRRAVNRKPPASASSDSKRVIELSKQQGCGDRIVDQHHRVDEGNVRFDRR
jgi:hypothetical protein